MKNYGLGVAEASALVTVAVGLPVGEISVFLVGEGCLGVALSVGDGVLVGVTACGVGV